MIARFWKMVCFDAEITEKHYAGNVDKMINVCNNNLQMALERYPFKA